MQISFSNLSDIFLQQAFFLQASPGSRSRQNTFSLNFSLSCFPILCSFCINFIDASSRLPPPTSPSVFVAWMGGVELPEREKNIFYFSGPGSSHAWSNDFPESFSIWHMNQDTFFLLKLIWDGLVTHNERYEYNLHAKIKNAKIFKSIPEHVSFIEFFLLLSRAESRCDKYPRRRWGQALLLVIAGGQENGGCLLEPHPRSSQTKAQIGSLNVPGRLHERFLGVSSQQPWELDTMHTTTCTWEISFRSWSNSQGCTDLVNEGVGNGTQQSDSRAHIYLPFLFLFDHSMWHGILVSGQGWNQLPPGLGVGVLTTGLPYVPFSILHLTEVMCEHLPSCLSWQAFFPVSFCNDLYSGWQSKSGIEHIRSLPVEPMSQYGGYLEINT